MFFRNVVLLTALSVKDLHNQYASPDDPTLTQMMKNLLLDNEETTAASLPLRPGGLSCLAHEQADVRRNHTNYDERAVGSITEIHNLDDSNSNLAPTLSTSSQPTSLVSSSLQQVSVTTNRLVTDTRKDAVEHLDSDVSETSSSGGSSSSSNCSSSSSDSSTSMSSGSSSDDSLDAEFGE